MTHPYIRDPGVTATTGRSAPVSRIGLEPLADQPLGALPSTTDHGPQPVHWPPVSARRQVHTFHTRAQTKLAPPPCRTPPGQSAGSRQAHPGPVLQTRFWRHLSGFDTSSADRLRSPSWPIPDALNGAPCPQRSPPRLLTAAACGGLTFPCRAATEDHQPNGPAPPSPMQHRINQSDLLHRPPSAFRVHTRTGHLHARPAARITGRSFHLGRPGSHEVVAAGWDRGRVEAEPSPATTPDRRSA